MKKRLLAGFLTVTMLMSLFPLPALALEGQRSEWAVTAFDPLDEGTAFQTVSQGGGEPVLPDALTAWAYRIEDDTTVIVPPEGTEQTPPADGQEEPPATGEDSGGADPAPGENGGEADPAPVEDGGDALTAALVENDPAPAEKQEPDIQQITIPGVTWAAEPEYDHSTPGEYIYTPVLPAAYAVDEGVELPTITVTVEAARKPEQTAVERVQALIDALPDPEGVTLDNAEDVAAQLATIDEESETLTEEELAALDFARYEAVMLTLAALMDDTPAFFTTASNIQYLDCDANGKNWTTKTCSSATVVESGTTTWNNGWYVVNSNVTVGSRITVNGTVHLILADGCKLNAENGGINVSDGNSLTIYAQSIGDSMGQLSAIVGNDQAGIGGGFQQSGGVITINGGTVTATGTGSGAGIGSGRNGTGGTININGGTVTATGGNDSAGIGGGSNGRGGTVTITITINGGTVTATGGSKYNDGGAGIGGGYNGSGGTININGGDVTATGGEGAAGIGGGIYGEGGTITINGGSVTATGGTTSSGGGAGIGGGGGSKSVNSININGGVIIANGGENGAAGIGGGGHDGRLENLSITGGWIQATGHYRNNEPGNGNANAIGGGGGGSSSNLSSSTAIILDGTAKTAMFYGDDVELRNR